MVEKAGVAIKKLLQRSDPFKSRKCERGDCPVCREDRKGPCDRQGVTNDIKCTECNDIYIGARIPEEKNKEITGQKGREVSLMEAL